MAHEIWGEPVVWDAWVDVPVCAVTSTCVETGVLVLFGEFGDRLGPAEELVGAEIPDSADPEGRP